ncbi:MAG: 2-oxo acid dehydrogenase subunit E2 [Dehalococcoidia bacterium]|nr:2-oxo acid dehydrogenase subunit E2 [Dehalococcoidia bacterium]
MSDNIVMPQMGYDMKEGTLVRWLVKEGSSLKRGDPIAEIETDKAVVEIESYFTGFIGKILINEGESAEVGSSIAVVVKDMNESVSDPSSGTNTISEESSSKVNEKNTAKNIPVDQPPVDIPVVDQSPSEKIKISPVAEKLAIEQGIDLNKINGTGPGGRITKADIEAQVSNNKPTEQPVAKTPPQTVLPGENIPLSTTRSAIARITAQSKNGIPHFYVSMSIDMTDALVMRQQYGKLYPNSGITVNSLVLMAVKLALIDYPIFNSSFREDHIEVKPDINLGIAISVDDGLIVPAITQAQDLSIIEISSAARDLAKRAKEGKLRQEEYSGTFSVSNLGMFAVDDFNAIILPPQVGVLAVSSVIKRPVVIDDKIVIREIMNVQLSSDHRVIDGVDAAKFAKQIKDYLEMPISLFVS